MRWSVHIELPDTWRLGLFDGKDFPLGLLIRHAKVRSWAGGSRGQLTEQRFDGRYAYLYAYEGSFRKDETIQLQTNRPDLHVLYVLESSGLELLLPENKGGIFFQARKAQYVFLPKGNFEVRMQRGKHLIFGAILDAGIFRPPAKRPFYFLDNLLDASKQGSTEAMASLAIKICKSTQSIITHLLQNLQPNNIENESFILQQVLHLIRLTQIHYFEEFEKISSAQRLVDRARKLLEIQVKALGKGACLQKIADELEEDVSHLGRLHQQIHQKSLQQYRNELLVQRIDELSKQSKPSLLELSYILGYSCPSHLARFYKGKTGFSIRQKHPK